MKLILIIVFLINSCVMYALDITISGFKNNKGNALVLIFNSQNGFPDNTNNAIQKYKVRIINNKASISDTILKSGNYSISVLHDENNNNLLDKNWLGIPKEGIGFSNNPSFTFGAPSFKSCLIEISKKINILIKYL